MLNLAKKELTGKQYRRSNKTMAVAITLVYIFFILLALTKVPIAQAAGVPKIAIVLVLAVIYAVTAWYTLVHIEEKKSMILMSLMFTLSYIIMLSCYSSDVLFLVFPVLFSMVCFMNEVLVIAGSVVTFVILVTKFVIVLVTSANLVEENLIVIGIFCLAITIFGGCRSVKLIVTYSNEDADIIKAKAAQQHETAVLVEEIVNELDDEFHGLVDELTSINSSITNSNDVIDRIAGGSESTADAAIRQTEMTNEIQERLENTSEIADSAMTTADDVKNVVMDGKLQSDELSHQSQVVDESTAKISETITKLVENVSKVSEITDTILAISAQTNLLALNASIEAARAGEAGKGFAVVADEIRDLAEKTKESTESITTIVNQLIAVTDETKRGLDISVESINVQREKVREVTESFATVENGITEVYGGMQTVYSEVTAVLNANQSIVDGITTLSAVSEEISAETQTSKDEMDNILTSMSRFSEVMDGTFQKLQSLKETTTLTEEDE